MIGRTPSELACTTVVWLVVVSLRTLGAMAYRLMRSVKSSAILGGDGFGLGGGLGTVLGLRCVKMSASLASATLVSVPKTSNGASGAGLRKR